MDSSDVVGDKIVNEGGEWQVKVFRKLNESELYCITYDLKGVALDLAYKLIEDPTGERAAKALRTKGVFSDNFNAIINLAILERDLNKEKLLELFNYTLANSGELDLMHRHWRSFTLQLLVDLVTRHFQGKTPGAIEDGAQLFTFM